MFDRTCNTQNSLLSGNEGPEEGQRHSSTLSLTSALGRGGLNIVVFDCTCNTQNYFLSGNEDPEEGQRYSSTLSLTSALDRGGWSTPRSACVAPWKESLYPFYTKLGGPQSRSGLVGKGPPPYDIRSPDRPARSESLYRLSYPGPWSRLCVEDKSTHVSNETPVLQ